MNVLEKILEEIKKLKQEQNSQNQDYVTGYISALSVTEGIVSKHMSRLSRENNQENTRLPRDNGGWIPVEARLPEPNCDVLVQWEKYERYTDTIYTYMDKMWFDNMDENGNAIFETIGGTPNGKIIAWQPLPEPYRPEKGTEE